VKSDREVLEGALKLIEDEEHWCKGTFSYPDRDGKPMAWCLEGAVRHVVGLTPEGISQVLRLEGLMASRVDAAALHSFNDDDRTTHEDVVLLLKQTIEELQ
jgi:hypothetical protein